METATPAPVLPVHVGDALQAIADMQSDHHEQASPLARAVDRITATVARPDFLIYVGAAVVVWMGLNAVLGRAHLAMPDAVPFPLLALLISCVALFIAVLILASQRRADRLANLRQQMILETTLLITEKASKLVELMEELRRDSPNVRNRVDLQALEMAGAPDHGSLLQALQDITDTPPGITDQPPPRGFAD
jgi:uncharacterized membrane protein